MSLALIAAVLGAIFAVWGSDFLVASLSQRSPLPEIPFNWTLLTCAFVVAILSGVLSGVPLALMVWKSGLNESLKQDSRSQAAARTEHRLGHLLVVSETTLTVMLLIGAGLLVKSFIRLQQVDLGVDPRHALTADLILSRRYVDPERREVYVQQLLDAVGALPGVQDVAVHADPPFTGGGWRETFNVEGHADPRPDRGHAASFNAVRGKFFRAMGIPIIRGRDFDQQDTATSPPVAVINETMARQFWPEGDAIGKRLRFYYDKNPQRWLSIVGVVRDVRYHGRFSDPVPQVFVPGQQPFYKAQEPYISLVVRTAGDPAAQLSAVQARIWAVDKDQPIAKLQPMDQTLWKRRRRRVVTCCSWAPSRRSRW